MPPPQGCFFGDTMPDKKAVRPFGRATLKELYAESRRLREEAALLRKKMTDLAKVIGGRQDELEGQGKRN